MLPRQMTPGQYAEQYRLFMDAVAPIHAMKAHVYSLYLPTVILDSAGNLVSAAYPEEMQEMIKQLDEMIQQVADQWLRT